MSMSMLGSALCDSASVRVQYLPWLTVPIPFWVELGSGCNVRVSARFWLSLSIWWSLKENDVMGLLLVPGLGLELSFH